VDYDLKRFGESKCLFHKYCITVYVIFIVTCDSSRGLDWWLDLLTAYALTTRDYTLQITDTHILVSSVYYSLH
jgi:hypothetical protein